MTPCWLRIFSCSPSNSVCACESCVLSSRRRRLETEIAVSETFNASAASLREDSRSSISFCNTLMRSRSSTCSRSACDWRVDASSSRAHTPGVVRSKLMTTHPRDASLRIGLVFFSFALSGHCSHSRLDFSRITQVIVSNRT